MQRRITAYISGCLLGGAVGDALGAPIEFLSLAQIRQRFGPAGITGYTDVNSAGQAEITDDTQMTLFTLEGLLLAHEHKSLSHPLSLVHRAYLRWLKTQQRHQPVKNNLADEGWLLNLPELWKMKAPGNTCLSALSSGQIGTPQQPLNHSKGCGGVMRVAPLGYFYLGAEAFAQGVSAAAITHGHPSGYLSAGLLAQIIAEISASEPGAQDEKSTLLHAIHKSLEVLRQWNEHEETLLVVQNTLRLVEQATPSADAVEQLGGGWVGEEALAIALFCALAFPTDFSSAVLLAVNHSGDSDSTGAICGNILGALNGIHSIPTAWEEKIELRNQILSMAAKIS